MKYSLKNILESKTPGYLLKLFVFFSIFSFLIILLLVYFGIREIYIKQSIREAEHDAIGISKVIFEHQHNMFLAFDSEGNKTLKVSPEQFSDLDNNMLYYLAPLNIVKIKIFSKDRKIIYSTDHSIIGQTDINNIKLERALKGEVVSRWKKKEDLWDIEGKQKSDRDIVEAYIPVKDENNEILGSFEIYLDISRYRENVKNALKLSMAILTITLLLAFGFLFLIMRRGTKQLDKNQAQLRRHASYDQLTNLPNRTNFVKYLGRMLKRTKRESDYLFAVLFIDLDRFKLINDSLGHTIGDKLLIGVARRLEVCTRPTDRISRDAGTDRVSRFGGDEFAVFLNDIKDITSASRVGDRIQMALQKPFNIDGHELFTSASIGIALSATEYKNAEDILRDADSAMYRAKETGRARAEIFDDEMRIKVSQILQLESDLRTAVEKEQFMVYYQPIVSATDSRITGAEALIRWNHPEQGFIPPVDFIPIAEETGLISTIGEWVLRTACAQNKAWHDAGYQDLLMKVNFSSRQFKDKNLIEVVTKIIKDTGIPAQLLDVEITESIAIEKNSIQILNQLTTMGLQTSIDDFGTGYSSLALLTEFPINTIKIDKAFVDNLAFSSTAEAIIKAIIAMAHSLNIEVVAEGVETEEQLAFLKSQKCDKIQGYLFSPPVPEEKFRKLLEQCTIVPSPIN